MSIHFKTFYTHAASAYTENLLYSFAHRKAFSKALFLFLLVVSFLASCTTDDPASTTNTNDIIPLTFTCPESTETVFLSIPVGMTELPLTDALTGLTITGEPNTAAPSITYEPMEVTIETSTVVATAMDEAGNEATCTFTVAVTQDMASDSFTDTTITCSAASPTSATLDAERTPIVLTEVLANVSGITATDGGTEIPSATFIYTPATLSSAGKVPVVVTVQDVDGNVATSGGVAAECRFDFTVIATPALSACPTDITHAEINIDVTWTAPTLADGPDDATVEVSVTSTDVDISTAIVTETTGTFTVVGTYTVTFAAMDGESPVIVGENPLSCSFEVTAMARPGTSEFSLAMNDAPPSADNPFLIRTDTDLTNLARVVNDNEMYSNINVQDDTPVRYATAAYRLANDITLSEGNNNFTPIGSGTIDSLGIVTCNEGCFEGTFDGASNTISGLHFSSNLDNIGFFGVISAASIRNLALANVNISGIGSIGGLVGIMTNNSLLSNVSVSGSVVGSALVAGGLVGRMTDSSITNAFSSADTTSSIQVGGLVGAMTNSTLINVSASGTVTGLSSSLGGLVGQMAASHITNASASGDISRHEMNTVSISGGLVGQVGSGASSITNAIAWGINQMEIANRGGLVGFAFLSATVTIANSYWDSTVNNGLTSDGNEQTTEQLRTPTLATGIYTNWNDVGDTGDVENDVWDFGTETQYPVLKTLPISVADQQALQTQ